MSNYIDGVSAKGPKGAIQIHNGMGDFHFHKDVSVDIHGNLKASKFISKSSAFCKPNDLAYFDSNTELMSSANAKITDKQILMKKGTIEYPILALQGDTKTGFYSSINGSLSFSSEGNKKFEVSRNNMSIVGGSVLVPSLNFGLKASDRDTGLYRIKQGEIGFSSQGRNAMSVTPKGLIVRSGIQRISEYNNWEDGYLGDSTGITLVPNEFINKTLQKVVPKGFKLTRFCAYTDDDTKQSSCVINKIHTIENFETNKFFDLEFELIGDGIKFISIQLDDLESINYARLEMIRI